jgi:predicted molibdopterin-dependent oxidoreductase YjgC
MPRSTPQLTLAGAPIVGQAGNHPLVPVGLARPGLVALREAGAAAWENRDSLFYAWRLLNRAVCDHCELGPRGLRDDVLPGRHLCSKRLKQLRGDTIGSFVPADVRDLRLLRQRSATGLRSLGRISTPFVARKGDRGFSRIPWDEALELAGSVLNQTEPDQMAFLAGTRGLTNETLYAFARAARLLGGRHIDLCVPRTVAETYEILTAALGREASTCSVSDIVGTDLLLLCNTRASRDQPALDRVVRAARATGTRVVALNAHTDVDWADDILQVRSPSAFLGAVLWMLQDSGALQQAYLTEHVTGWKTALRAAQRVGLDSWLDAAGARREHAEWLATLIGRSDSWVTLAGPDPDAIKCLVALHLGRGAMGRRGCGILALGGGGNFQGARDCGVSPFRFPGGGVINKTRAARLKKTWGHAIAPTHGHTATEQLEAAAAGDVAVLYALGADVLSTFGASVQPGLARVSLRIHQATHLDPSMLLDPAETVLILPMETPQEQRGGGTITSVERRVRYSPRVPGYQPTGLARPAWQIPGQIATAAQPGLASAFEDQAPGPIRQEIRNLVPEYDGLQILSQAGDWFQWGGPQLYRSGSFKAKGDKARFAALTLP